MMKTTKKHSPFISLGLFLLISASRAEIFTSIGNFVFYIMEHPRGVWGWGVNLRDSQDYTEFCNKFQLILFKKKIVTVLFLHGKPESFCKLIFGKFPLG